MKRLMLSLVGILCLAVCSQAQVQIQMINKSIFIGWIDIEYQDQYGTQQQKIESGDISQNGSYSKSIASNSKNIYITPWYKQGLEWKKMSRQQISGSGTLTLTGDLISAAYAKWDAEQSGDGGGTVNASSIDVIGDGGNYKIHVAARMGATADVKQLLRSGTQHVNTKNNVGNAPLHEAVKMGKIDVIEPLISGGANVNLKNANGEEPILIAVKKRDLNLVNELLGHNASLNNPIIMQEAVKTNNEDMVKTLLGRGGSATVAADEAISGRKTEMFESIVIGHSITPKLEWYKTALNNRQVETANKMMDLGLDPNQAMKAAYDANNREAIMGALDHGGSPGHALTYAVNNSDESLAAAAIENGANVNYNYPHVLAKKDLKLLPIFLQNGASANEALAKAIEDSHVQMAEVALENEGEADLYMTKAIKKQDSRMVGTLINYISNPDDYLSTAVTDGDMKIVQTLVDNAFATPDRGLQPAMNSGKYDIAKFLIERGAVPDNVVRPAIQNNQTALLKAALNGNADANEGMDLAVNANNTEYVKLLLDFGADGSPDQYIRTASEKQNMDMISMLVNNGASPEPGMPVAVNSNNTQLFKLLVANGGNAGNTEYVKTAASNANMEILRECVQQGGNPDPALPIAVGKDHTEMVKFLLDNGANGSNSELFANATTKANATIIQYLLDFGANPQDGAVAAVNRGDATIVRKLIDTGADFSRDDFMKNAASRNLPQLTAMFLEVGGNPDAGMLEAAKGNFSDIMIQFVNAGANLNDPQILGYPSANGNDKVVQLMLNNGADPNNGLSSAVKYSRVSTSNILLNAGADGSSDALIKMAAENKSAPIVEALLKAGGNPQIVVPIAVKGDDANSLKLACNGGADCSSDQNIQYAVHQNFLTVAGVLLYAGGANPNTQYNDGSSLLHKACENGISQMIDLLIKAGANVNATMSDNATPLHIIVPKGKDYLKHATILIEGGADVNAKTSAGLSVFKSAKSKKMKKLLLDNGADKKA
ncbi:MAG: ankyrin repeat domain-containing protein [Bacteroidota bacterium]